MSAIFQSCGWQAGFLQLLPAVRTHAKIQFRHLPVIQREEAIAETIAAACVSYQRLAAQGKLDVAHPGTLATYAVNHVRNGRHIGGHQDAAKDVLSPVCQRRHGVKIQSLSARPSDSRGWGCLVTPDRKADIPELACFRLDFAEYLRTLSRRDRRIVSRLAAGERTMEVAERFGMTASRISQLRRRYELAWLSFQRQALTNRAA
jgi:hypothetical protein